MEDSVGNVEFGGEGIRLFVAADRLPELPAVLDPYAWKLHGAVDILAVPGTKSEKQIPHPAKDAGIRDDKFALARCPTRKSTEPSYIFGFSDSWRWRSAVHGGTIPMERA